MSYENEIVNASRLFLKNKEKLTDPSDIHLINYHQGVVDGFEGKLNENLTLESETYSSGWGVGFNQSQSFNVERIPLDLGPIH